MRAGRLRRRLTVDEPITSRNDTGEELVTWVTRGTIWAAIEPGKGKEDLVANQITADTDTRIVVRWSGFSNGINAKWRFVHQGVKYNIESISHKNLGQREIEFMCKSGLNDG
jgi:SPP1 family predicted phage head-tail adaptor